ncbi:hypothetical protein LWC34_21875 [Kibdelosporangium philippinense]|uniref:Uncharacterized protein n=2 Tax=Kibdelosporangium philippinense TaxID=211113 RepID=A0ABS8ZFK4_9PSEU|nr:hypothetical protein [Kibdelosporangium philippinense]MCE7005456.1 hypothetical protein [Kibdelosporangium philippinense]
MDNKISSLHVSGGTWCLFDGYDFNKSIGGRWTVTPGDFVENLANPGWNTPEGRNPNDVISSIKLGTC